MILEKKAVSWTCGKNHSLTRHGFKYVVQCDNPDCGKIFERQEKEINKSHKEGSKNQYCNAKCQSSHYVGVCSKDNCNEPVTNAQKKRGHDNGLCRKHSSREQSRKNAIKYRQRDKNKLHKLLGGACVCCGEKDSMYLEIDHVHNDGGDHRRQINKKYVPDDIRCTSTHPRHYLNYLKENPNGLQLLCSNCNRAKSKNGGELYIPDKFTQRKRLAA